MTKESEVRRFNFATEVSMSDRKITGLDFASGRQNNESRDLLLICEHASNYIPDRYAGLGLSPEILNSHIAWDPGARAVAERIGENLGAPLIACEYSRLLFDCNRPPDRADAICEESDNINIPGNHGLTSAERQRRAEDFYFPFYARIEEAAKNKSAIVTIHSFTPVYKGKKRDVELGILHDVDSRLADALLEIIANHTDLTVKRNEPYGPADGVTHTLKAHALPDGKLNVMIEIRNDLIADAPSQTTIADMLSRVIADALTALDRGTAGVRSA